MSGLPTLFRKEVLRFWKVIVQTVAAPVLSALLFLIVFAQALEGRAEAPAGATYAEFLAPGLAMMSMLQNAFANSSSSLIQSKITGNLVFVLLAPISPLEFYCAYVLAAVVRALVVGAGVLAAAAPFADLAPVAPLWALAFALVSAAALGALGLVAGIVADKFDQVAAFQNFLILPLTFLAGVFYSVHGLPEFWQAVSYLNPFFYMVDGFRYGFLGASDFPPLASFAIAAVSLGALTALALALLGSGYKLRG